MPTPFIMPKFDMDQEKSRIVEWIKGEGDSVELDEIVLVVETDKVAIEVPSPASGTLAQISAKEGDEVPVTSVIAFILAEGESVDDLPPAAGRSEITQPNEGRERPAGPGVAAAEVQRRKSPAAVPLPEIGRLVLNKPVTPIAQKMILELGIDVGQISGTGGRITKKDIERYLAKHPQVRSRVQVPATPAARRLGREFGLDLSEITGTGPGGRVQAADVKQAVQDLEPDYVPDRPAERVPLAGIRRTIAERMQTSFQTAPHIFLTVEVDVTNLESRRRGLNPPGEETNISLTSMIVMHIARVLVDHPFLNASLINEDIFLWREVNIGVAAAINEGLIVPVIRDADQKSISEIDDLLKKLAQKARAGKLMLEDVQGGTFTLSNLGMFGVDQFQAIINPPESAILAVGQVIRKPVVVDNQDTVSVRPRMSMTLSADHRVIDGVTAARFLRNLVQAIESP